MTPEEFDQLLDDLEIRLERLRSLYEQYFMGMERIEPTVARKDVDRRFWMMRREKVRNTAKRFRLQMLVQRYNTLQQYWQRTCREIDAGTYRRHRLKAERANAALAAATAEPVPVSSEVDSNAERAQAASRSAEDDLRAMLAGDTAAEVDAALDAIFGGPERPAPKAPVPERPAPKAPPPTVSLPSSPRRAAPPPRLPPGAVRVPPPPKPPPPPAMPAHRSVNSAPPARPAAPPARPPAPPAQGLTDARIRELHQRYLATRQGGASSPVSLDKLASNLRATEQKLRQQHAGRRVDFDIVLKDGKPVIKPKIF